MTNKEAIILIGHVLATEPVEEYKNALAIAIKALEEKPEKKREYKKIYLCGDCGFYNWKKHKCGRGATEEGAAMDTFYKDCPLPSGEEET